MKKLLLPLILFLILVVSCDVRIVVENENPAGPNPQPAVQPVIHMPPAVQPTSQPAPVVVEPTWTPFVQPTPTEDLGPTLNEVIGNTPGVNPFTGGTSP